MADNATRTVHQALAAVMGDVQAVKKGQRNTTQNYNFRGVDAVVNAVGPALREHGVIVVPIAEEIATDHHYTTKSGANMRNVTLRIRWRIHGPAGDNIEAVTYGEAADSGDKAVSKAHSVALRTVLLQALCIPTDDPEPDAQTYERAAPQPAARQRASASKGGNDAQTRKMWALMNEAGIKERQDGLDYFTSVVGRTIESSKELTKPEQSQVIKALEQLVATEEAPVVDGDGVIHEGELLDDAPQESAAPPFSKDEGSER